MRIALLALVLCHLSGCSLVVDTDRYRPVAGDDDDDTGDPDGPSRPEVQIEPATPTAYDTLNVQVTTESVDPRGGEIAYLYEWTRDEETQPIVHEASVPAFTGHKGETWTVRVVPVAGTRRGAAATASVTFANAPPTMLSMGLSTYEPIVGDTIRGVPGFAFDPDGDAVTIEYEWTRSGSATPIGARRSLDLVAAYGDLDLTLVARATDGEDESDAREAGPVRVYPDTTRFRPLLPNRVGQAAPLPTVFDPQHDRFVTLADDGTVWEFAMGPESEGFVRLVPGGAALRAATDPPLGAAMATYDTHNQRMLVLFVRTEGAPAEMFALDLSHRGRESWAPVTMTGGPTDAVFASFAVDQGSPRIFVLAPRQASPLAVLELFEIDVEHAGAERWVRLAGDLPLLLAPGFAKHPTEDRLYLFGGSSAVTGPPAPVDSVYRIDLGASDPALTQIDDLPSPLFAASASPSPDGRAIVFGLGLTSALYVFDLEEERAIPLEARGGPPLAAFATLGFGAFARLFAAPQYLQRGASPSDGVFALSFYEIDLEALEWRAISRYGVDLPPSLSMALASAPRGAAKASLLFGRTDLSETSADRFDLDFASGQWARAEVDGLPAPRFGMSLDASSELVVALGETRDGLADRTVYATADSVLQELGDLGEEVPLRTGGVTFDDRVCGPGRVGIAFGLNAPSDDTPTDAFPDVLYATCPGGACSTASLSLFSRSFAAGSRTPSGRDLLLFGGSDADGPTNTFFRVNDCGTEGLDATIEGLRPLPRDRHTFTLVRRGDDHGYVVVGGRISLVPALDAMDVWLLQENGAGFSSTFVDPAGTAPLARSGHMAVWDEARSRLLIYGGHRSAVDGTAGAPRSDLYELRFREALDLGSD